MDDAEKSQKMGRIFVIFWFFCLISSVVFIGIQYFIKEVIIISLSILFSYVFFLVYMIRSDLKNPLVTKVARWAGLSFMYIMSMPIFLFNALGLIFTLGDSGLIESLRNNDLYFFVILIILMIPFIITFFHAIKLRSIELKDSPEIVLFKAHENKSQRDFYKTARMKKILQIITPIIICCIPIGFILFLIFISESSILASVLQDPFILAGLFGMVLITALLTFFRIIISSGSHYSRSVVATNKRLILPHPKADSPEFICYEDVREYTLHSAEGFMIIKTPYLTFQLYLKDEDLVKLYEIIEKQKIKKL